jgi:hypothetical protein
MLINETSLCFIIFRFLLSILLQTNDHKENNSINFDTKTLTFYGYNKSIYIFFVFSQNKNILV